MGFRHRRDSTLPLPRRILDPVQTAADPAMSLEFLAKRYVWWEPPADVLARPETLIRQVLRLGTPEDYRAIEAAYGEPAIREALSTAPPGAIDDRSWHFWHLKFGLPCPPPPRRTFE